MIDAAALADLEQTAAVVVGGLDALGGLGGRDLHNLAFHCTRDARLAARLGVSAAEAAIAAHAATRLDALASQHAQETSPCA